MGLLEPDSVIGARSCHFGYIVSQRSNIKPLQTKRLALQLYLEGLERPA
jgi:hypothetical protein